MYLIQDEKETLEWIESKLLIDNGRRYHKSYIVICGINALSNLSNNPDIAWAEIQRDFKNISDEMLLKIKEVNEIFNEELIDIGESHSIH